MPSTVLTRWPAQARPSTRQDRTGVASTSTVQVPHSPNSQPCFVPVSPASSRSTSSSVLCGAKATSTASPFSSSAIFSLVSTMRSEEHTSELQSRLHLVCRLLLEKKKKKQTFPSRHAE